MNMDDMETEGKRCPVYVDMVMSACALTLLLIDSMFSIMTNMDSDMRLGSDRMTESTPDGPSKRAATCTIVSANTEGVVNPGDV